MSDKDRIVRDYISAYNSFNTESMIENFDAGIEFINEFNGDITMTTTGIDEFKGQAEHAKNYFQFRNLIIEDLTVKNDIVTVTTAFSAGMITGKEPGKPAQIRNIEMKGTAIFYFKDNKIVKMKDIY